MDLRLLEEIKQSSQHHRDLIQSIDDLGPAIDDDGGSTLHGPVMRWLDLNRDGFYVRDLFYLNRIIEYFEAYIVNVLQAEHILDKFLELCSMPLMELKGNERLSVQGYADIKRFYSNLSTLWLVSNSTNKVKLGKCFRCIVNGGRDPSVLRSMQKEWVPEDYRLRITDTGFIQKAFRESGSLHIVTAQLISSADILNYGKASSTDEYDDMGRETEDLADETDHSTVGVPDMDDPESYGVPKSFLETRRLNMLKANDATTLVIEEVESLTTPDVLAVQDTMPDIGAVTDVVDSSVDVILDDKKENLEEVGSRVGVSNHNMADAEVKSNEGGDVHSMRETDGFNEVKEQSVDNADMNMSMQSTMESVGRSFASAPNISIKSYTSAPSIPGFTIDVPQQSPSTVAGSKGSAMMSTVSINDTPAILRELSSVLLFLCLDLSLDPLSAAIMCESSICDGAITLVQKDFRLNQRDPRILSSIELMWNVLEHFLEQFKSNNATPEDMRNILSQYADRIVDFGRAIPVLQSIVRFVLSDGFRLADKELRNEVLIILTMFAQFPSAVGYFIDAGLFHLLITYACIEEAGANSWDGFSKDIGKYRNFATISDVDLEFKRGLWFVISELLRSNDPDALSIVASSPLQATMLIYLEQDSSEISKKTGEVSTNEGLNLSTSIGNININVTVLDTMNITDTSMTLDKKKTLINTLPLSKLRDFQQLSATFLLHNAPRMLDVFESMQGPIRVLSIVVKYCLSEVAEHKSLIFTCLMLLQKCIVLSLSVRHFMEENNIMQTFLYVYQKTDQERTQAQALSLIATLCEDDNVPMQSMFDQLVLANYVRKRPALTGLKAGLSIDPNSDADIPDPFENPYGGETSILVISVLSCLMKAIIGNPALEDKFAEAEGIDILFDLTETTHFILRLQIFRFLSDILSNKSLIVYANSWRSAKTLRSAAQILCHAWLDEEARLIGEKRKNGILEDISHPLGRKVLADDPDDSNQEVGNLGSESSLPGAYFVELANNSATSITVAKLSNAILAGRNATQTNLPVDICIQALEKDSRLLISNILLLLNIYEIYGVDSKSAAIMNGALSVDGSADEDYHHGSRASSPNGSVEGHRGGGGGGGSIGQKNRVSFDNFEGPNDDNNQAVLDSKFSVVSLSPSKNINDLGLTSQDKQVLVMAHKYNALREGEWWQFVRDSAKEAAVTPIEADLELIQQRLQYSCDAGRDVMVAQEELFQEYERMRKNDEHDFIDQILTKKQQQIKAEWLKKNRTGLLPSRNSTR